MESNKDKAAEWKELFKMQEENYSKYAEDRFEFMNSLRKIMESYAESQRTCSQQQKDIIDEYSKQLERVIKARDMALTNERIALEALRKEQEKNEFLVKLLHEMHAAPSTSFNVQTIKPQ